MDFQHFQIVHSQLLQQIPPIYWKALYGKLTREEYDAGDYFMMSPLKCGAPTRGRYEVVVSAEDGIKHNDPECVFLVDHSWTYQLEYAKKHLEQIPGLAERMAKMMCLVEQEQSNDEEEDVDQDVGEDCNGGEETGEGGKEEDHVQEDGDDESVRVDTSEETSTTHVPNPESQEQCSVACILKELWRFNGTYAMTSASTQEERVPVWYVLDEFGSSIQHSSQPSFAMIPFYFANKGFALSILWPLRDMEHGEPVTVDYAVTTKGELMRAILLLPWQSDSLTLDSPLWEELTQFTVPPVKARSGETWPNVPPDPCGSTAVPSAQHPLKVFSELKVVREFLKHSSFKIVDSVDDADILWLVSHYKDFRSLPVGTFINQFPCEMVITCKDLLVTIARRASEESGCDTTHPYWLPLTYNLYNELPQLVREHMKRKEKNLPNVWIVKPWNLGRGMDSIVTDDINALIRLSTASPRVACEYLSNPVLFHREDVGYHVKFDIRYMLLLRSVQPLELYVYKIFWLRFANKPFSLEDLTDYQVHFTVMNYQNEFELKQIHYNDFIPLFEKQYPGHPWKKVEEDIFCVFKDLFKAAVSVPPPAGIAHSPQSRAIYACDLMLDWSTTQDGMKTMVPKILEMNFSPDCDRACKYHPQFFDHMFATLFLDNHSDTPVVRLL